MKCIVLFLAACGTASVDSTQLDSTEQGLTWCGDLPKPPYATTSRQVTLFYIIPTSRIEHLIAPQLRPTSVLGYTLLGINFTQFDDFDSLGSHCRDSGYNEVSYGIFASAGGRSGTTFFKLHISSEHARDMGIEYYGFPKTLSDVTITHQGNRVTATSLSMDGEQEFSFDGDRATGPLPDVLNTLSKWGAEFVPSRVLLVKDGARNISKLDVDIQRAGPVSVFDVRTPYLERIGVLDGDETPISAFFIEVDGSLSAPEFF